MGKEEGMRREEWEKGKRNKRNIPRISSGLGTSMSVAEVATGTMAAVAVAVMVEGGIFGLLWFALVCWRWVF